MAGIQGTCKGRASGEMRCGLAAAGRAPPRPRAMRRAQTAAAPPAPPRRPPPRAQATRALRAPARLEKRKGGGKEQEWRELESLNLTWNHYSSSPATSCSRAMAALGLSDLRNLFRNAGPARYSRVGSSSYGSLEVMREAWIPELEAASGELPNPLMPWHKSRASEDVVVSRHWRARTPSPRQAPLFWALR